MEHYDIVAVGGGTAGLVVTRLLAQRGLRAALIERAEPGGDCLYTGCVPTKALLHAAKLMHDVRDGGRFGVIADGARLDYAAVRDHVATAQAEAGRPDTPEAIAATGVKLIRGTAEMVDAHTIDVEGRRVHAGTIVIATGSEPAIPPIPGLAETGFDTNVTALAWDELPTSLAIIGGGPIGVEFAQMMARFGVRVTLIEADPRLVSAEDPEASATLASTLERAGVAIQTAAKATGVERLPEGIGLEVARDGGIETLTAERLLVATGRAPRVAGLGLERAGVRYSAKGVRVDQQLRASAQHIFAIGDVNGGPQFTHVAEDQARFVANLVSARSWLTRRASWNDRVIPRVTYTDPEIASVGLTERKARRRHRGVRTWRVPLDEIDRAIVTGQTDGFLKLVTASGWPRRVPGLARRIGDEIVGATLVAPNAGDLLVPIVVAMRLRLPTGLLAWNMQAYPTMGLGIRQVAGAMFERRE